MPSGDVATLGRGGDFLTFGLCPLALHHRLRRLKKGNNIVEIWYLLIGLLYFLETCFGPSVMAVATIATIISRKINLPSTGHSSSKK